MTHVFTRRSHRKHRAASRPQRLAAGAVALLMVGLGLLVMNSASASSSLPSGTTSLWNLTAVPKVTDDGDTASVELGTRFTPSVDGQATGVAFYKNKRNVGTHTATLWSANGTRLTTVTFAKETQRGWQKAMFSSPVKLTAGSSYVISYHAPKGHYAVDADYFNRPFSNGPLTATAGVFAYGSTPAFPTSTWRASNYYVDVLFSPSSGAGATSPTPTTTTSPAPAPTTTTTSPAPTTTTSPAPAPTTTTATSPAPAPTSTTASPAPTPTQTSASSSSGFPSASSTGYPHGLPGDSRAAVALSDYTGPMTVTTNGAVIDGKRIRGNLVINVPGGSVTVRNSQILAKGVQGITVRAGHVNVSDTEIDGMNSSNGISGVGDSNFTLTRVDIHGFADGVRANGNVQMNDSYIHDLYQTSTSHNDGVQSTGGSRMVFKHNRIDNAYGQTSAFLFKSDFGNISDVTVEANLVNGGGYTVYAMNAGAYTTSKITFSNNAFGKKYFPKCGQYGPTSIRVPVTWTGNVWEGTTTPVS